MSQKVSYTQTDMTEENCANLHNFMESFERSIQWDLAREAMKQRSERP